MSAAAHMSEYTELPKVGAASATAANDSAPVAGPAAASDTPTALALREVTTNIAEFDSVEAGLQAIEAKFGGVVFDVQTPKGFTAAKEARADIREPRYAVQNAVKNAKTPLNNLKSAIAARGEEIIKRITAVEDPIDAQIKAEEKRRADAKLAEEKAAAERKAAIDGAKAEIVGRIAACINQPAAFIAETIEWLDNTEVEEADYGDRTLELREDVRTTRERLVGMRQVAEQAETAAAEAKVRADELKQREEELAAREAIAKRIDAIHALPDEHVESSVEELRAAIASIATLDPELFGVRIREANRAAAAVLPELQALLEEAITEAEAAALRTPDAAPEAEAEPATVEETQIVAAAPAPPAPAAIKTVAPAAPTYLGRTYRPAQPAAATPAKPTRPTDDELIEALSLHYRVHESVVIAWLLDMDLKAASDRLLAAPF